MITCTLSRPGLPCNCSMQLIKFSIILNILYALLVWGSCLSSEQINRINTLFKRSYRCGSAKQINDIVTLVDNASKDLFGKTMAPHHCLHSLLPPQTENKHDLRTRGHNFPLPQFKYNVHRNSFQSDLFLSMFNCFYSLSRFCSDVCVSVIC